ncbi:MAG: enoyl-CoA hydratase/isomerase family protein [Nitriliruptorales bacterium]|nr:enoyl-CoA hydratase/isomerase family protein [Nitriliruptorales bacterium]
MSLNAGMAMGDDLVRFSADGRVGRVELNRPEQGNKVNVATMRAFIDALQRGHDDGVDVLVLSSAGSDFSLGRDQEERPTGVSKRDNLSLILDANALLTGFEGVTVAAVRGRALGFGCGVATQCDITVAGDGARFGFTEIRDGFAPSIVMTYLETYVPRKVALDLLMTGRTVSAAEALARALVSQVVPDDQLDAVVVATVDSLLDKPVAALRQCKLFLREIGMVPEPDRGAAALDALTSGS